MSSTTAAPPIRPSDYLALDALLSDEERDIRDTVRAFVRDKVVPNVGEWFEQATVPLDELAPRTGQARRAGDAPRGLRLRRRQRHRLRARLHGAGGGRQRHPQPRFGPGLAGDVRDLALGLGGAEAGVAAADGGRRGDRLLRPDRARRRLGPRLDADPRPPRRLRLDPARTEDVDHQRLGLRGRRRLGADRRRRPRLPRPAGDQGLHHPGHPQEALAAGLGHLGAAARRRAAAGRRGAARGQLAERARSPASTRRATGSSGVPPGRPALVTKRRSSMRSSGSSSTARSPRSRSSSRSWRRWCWR